MSSPPMKKLLYTYSWKIFISLLIAFNILFTHYNLQQLKLDETPEKQLTLHKETIFNGDNEYFLTPVDNYMHQKGWRRSPAVGNAGYIRRVPVYSAIHYVFRSVFDEDNYLFYLKYFQLSLFLVSIFCFSQIALHFLPRNYARFTTSLYAALPIFSVWTFFTITEAVTPELMLFYIFFLLSAKTSQSGKQKFIFYLLSAFILVLLILTRPYSAIAGILLLYCTIQEFRKNRAFFKLLILAYLPALIVWASWVIRNYSITGQPVLLEQAYHPESLDRMKPEFRGLLNFSKCWGVDGAYFNTYHEPFFKMVLSNQNTDSANQFVLSKLPPEIVQEFGADRLTAVLNKHQQALIKQKPYYDSVIAQPNTYFNEQLKTEQAYNELITEYKQKHAFNYWVGSRLLYLKRLMIHSSCAHIYVLSNPENTFLRLVKMGMFAVTVLAYLCLILNTLFLQKKNFFHFLTLVIVPVLFVFFFAFIHREIEQRYMLPIFPVLLIGIGMQAQLMVNFGKRIFRG